MKVYKLNTLSVNSFYHICYIVAKKLIVTNINYKRFPSGTTADVT